MVARATHANRERKVRARRGATIHKKNLKLEYCAAKAGESGPTAGDAINNPSSIEKLNSTVLRQTPQKMGHRLSAVDLFCGAGGLSEGFRQAGFRVLAGTDNDPDAMATYALNFPEAAAITGDIRDPSIREHVLEYARNASIIVGGPPCQAFSQVRNHSRMIDDPRNSLYREFVNVLRDALPMAFLMENVTGMDQMGIREQILADLSLAGEYRVLAQVVDAADFGVPQTRKRLLFVGIRANSGMSAPALTGTGAAAAVDLERTVFANRSIYRIRVQQPLLNSGTIKLLENPDDLTVVSADDALSDLAWLPIGNRDDKLLYPDIPGAKSAYQRVMRAGADPYITNVQVPRMQRDTVTRLSSIPPGGNFRDLPGHLLERYISGDRWGQDNGSGRLSRKHFYAYRRLHGGIWAWTLNTKADSVYHYSVARALSVREFARLQSFPDRFTFTTDPTAGLLPGRHDGGPAHSRYRQAGNAVPPLLAKAAASQLMQLLLQCAEVRPSRAV